NQVRRGVGRTVRLGLAIHSLKEVHEGRDRSLPRRGCIAKPVVASAHPGRETQRPRWSLPRRGYIPKPGVASAPPGGGIRGTPERGADARSRNDRQRKTDPIAQQGRRFHRRVGSGSLRQEEWPKAHSVDMETCPVVTRTAGFVAAPLLSHDASGT